MNARSRYTLPTGIALLLALALNTTPAVPDPHEDRLFDAIVDIFHVQLRDGGTAAIERLKACYQTHTRPGAGLTPELETCIVQDVAYAYFTNGLHGHADGEDHTLEYTDYEATESRIDAALDLAGLDDATQIEEMRRIGSISFKSAAPALEKAKALSEHQ